MELRISFGPIKKKEKNKTENFLLTGLYNQSIISYDDMTFI